MARPLEGVRVLDVSRILSGPYCTMLLADLGAQVVKVERPGSGDIARRMGPLVSGEAAYFMSVNRGKRSVALDIFTPDGQAVFRRMAAMADVLVENYTPGTMAKLGIGPVPLCAANPRLVYASISGFGQDGPYAERPALDAIVQAMGGIMSVTGLPGGEPLRPGVSLGDSVAGMFTALAIVTALYDRDRTGLGQRIDMSMLDCQVTLMENALARFFATGEAPKPIGSRHAVNVPFQTFETADGYVVVAMVTDDVAAWQAFCDAIGRPALGGDPRYKDNRSRWLGSRTLEPELIAAFKARSTAEWLRVLQAAGVPCSAIQDMAQVAADPQVAHRGMVRTVPHHAGGGVRMANTPFRFSVSETGPAGPSPALGQHTAEVLREWLGTSDEELTALRAARAIAAAAS